MALATAAAIVGATAAAAYIDARLHVTKDLASLNRLRKADIALAQAEKDHRVSCFYFFENAVSQFPDTFAIWSRSGNYTFQEAYERVCQYASFFLSLGAQPGEIIAMYMQNSPEFVFSWMAIWAIGCAPAMINYSLGADSLVHCLKISGTKIMIADAEAECQDRIKREKGKIEKNLGIKIVTLSDELKSEISMSKATRPNDKYRHHVTRNFPGALLYTSGTTGLPKAFPFPTATFFQIGCLGGRQFNQERGPTGDRWYICMPMYHGTGGVTATACLMSGITLAIGRKFSLSSFWSDVRDSEATFVIYVGETARYLLSAPPSPLDKQHKVRCIHGNGLRPDVWTKFQERFGIPEVAEFFNSTEGMFGVTNWSKNQFGRDAIPVAIDSETNDIHRDPQTSFAQRVPYSTGGEIIVRLDSVDEFPGYWRSETATAKKLVRDVFAKGDVFYRTGDALRRTDDGFWFFLDRLGDTYRWKAENVSTAEVAECLGKFGGIAEAIVYGVLVPGHDGRAGCAAITLESGVLIERFDWRALASYVKEKLPRYAVPVFLRVVTGEVGSMGSHNNKQNKVPLREEGIDPHLRGSKFAGGKEDTVLYMGPKKDTYVRFGDGEWDSLIAGNTRL